MLETIVASSVLIVILTVMRHFFQGKIGPGLQYAFWLLVAVRLLMPFPVLESQISVLNIVDVGRQASQRVQTLALEPAQPGTNQEVDPSVAQGGATGATNNNGNIETPSNPTHGQTSGSGSVLSEAKSGGILRAAWLIGAVAVGFWFILQNIWLYVKLRKTRQLVERADCRLPVYLSSYVSSPCIFGLRPAIYIRPDNLTCGQALRYILAHEETHYRHGDHLWSYLRCACLALHWFNPLVWWAAILSRRDCEIACDESTLNRIGDGHRKAYGNTLVSMIGCRARPSELLSATTMSSGKAGMKERITMIARKPKMLIGTLLTAILAMAVVVGCTFTGANGSDKDVTLHERAGLTIAIPNEYADQLLIDPVETADERILMSVYQKSTYEKYGGMGLLFKIARYTEAQYEQFLSSDGSGRSFFAKASSKGDSNEGSAYYGFFTPTDVQAPDDHEAYAMLASSVGDFVKEDFVERNRLSAHSDQEFFGRTYTYDGDHVFIKYYPYFAENGSKDEAWTLYLSQPVKQGAVGIWCVERWRDQYGNVYPYFPDADGVPSKEHYAALQAEADAGRQDLLDPKQAAMKFVETVFGHRADNPGSFEGAENSGIPAELYAQSTGDIHDYMPKLIAKEAVSAYDLLPCLENFTRTTWDELTAAYGSEWWDPLWAALRDAAVSEMRTDTSDQIMRDYYLGKALLAADGAYTEMVSDIVLRQWRDNSQLYSRAMSERFSADEATTLRSHLLYLVSHRGGTFHLGVPGSDPELSLSLNTYPVDFPFGVDLTEKTRETFQAESYGQVTVIEGEGFILKYLHNSEGVYLVYCIRTVNEGYFTKGVAIGDPEEKLWDHWEPTELRKLNEVSYEDEDWFGDDYDYAYVHVPQDSTKSIMYLVKDGRVIGIGLMNGLDGPMYPGV